MVPLLFSSICYLAAFVVIGSGAHNKFEAPSKAASIIKVFLWYVPIVVEMASHFIALELPGFVKYSTGSVYARSAVLFIIILVCTLFFRAPVPALNAVIGWRVGQDNGRFPRLRGECRLREQRNPTMGGHSCHLRHAILALLRNSRPYEKALQQARACMVLLARHFLVGIDIDVARYAFNEPFDLSQLSPIFYL